MTDKIVWTGDSWQEWVNKLIKMRHMEQYRIIPSKDRGDCGIEGFTVCGKAYQCYCPETAITSKWKIDVQKKMNEDLQKLQKNEAKFKALLGGVKLLSWHLVVPEDKSKDMTVHCNNKAKECMSWNLGIIGGNFLVTLETEENWPAEAHSLQFARAARIDFKTTPIPQGELSQWRAGNAHHFDNLRKKCERMAPLQFRDSWEEKIIQYHIEGKNALNEIRARYPEIYEDLIALKERKSNYLLEITSNQSGNGISTLQDVITNMKTSIKEELPSASPKVIDQLAREAIADWIMLCPLDFLKEDK